MWSLSSNKMRLDTYALACVIALAGTAAQAANLREIMSRMPEPPRGPTRREECEAFHDPYKELMAAANREHSECLAANHDQGRGGGENVCSQAPCQQLHDIVFGDYKKTIDAAYQQCLDQVREVEAAERQRKAELERRQQLYVQDQNNRIAASGAAQRDAQKQAYRNAQNKANDEARRLQQETSESMARANVFSQAARRNQDLFGSSSSRPGPLSSVSSVIGNLGGALDSIRAFVNSSSYQSPASTNPLSSALDSVPSSANLQRASGIFDIFSWPGAGTLGSAANVVGAVEQASDVWDAWDYTRRGDTVNAVGGGAVLLADFVMPSHVSFFAVPALRAVTAVHSAALQDLDRAFAQLDQVDYIGSRGGTYVPVYSHRTSGSYEPDFHNVQRAYVESLCEYCRWNPDSERWYTTIDGELVEITQDGDVSVGSGQVSTALGSQ
jgi:hypothetical protein